MSSVSDIVIVGCGYIGKLLATQLIADGHTVQGLVSSDASLAQCKQRRIPCHRIDFDDVRALAASELDVDGKALIYLVPPPRTGHTDTRLRNFLERIQSRQPQRVVLISTTGVYGDCEGRWVSEDAPLNPRIDRALRRADAERQAQTFCQERDVPLVVLRVPGIYGPGKLPLRRIEKGAPIVREQDSPWTNRIHAYDLVTICKTALINNDISGIYNCSDGNPGTMHDYFIKVADAAGLPRPPAISLQQARQQLSEGMLSYMDESRRIANDKLLRDFNISLKYPDIESGLKAGISLRENPEKDNASQR